MTRNYPPAIGGLEQYSYDLHENLSKRVEVRLVKNSSGLKYLPLFLLRAVFVGLFYGRKTTHFHFGDGLLSPLALLFKWFFRKPVTISVHGLDLNYPNPIYQFLIPKCLARLDGLVCVSDYTRDQCIKKNIPAKICSVITNGIDYGARQDSSKQPVLLGELLATRPNTTVIVSIGRLIPRKGVEWFVSHVVPKLPENIVYVIAGDGPDRGRIEAAVINKSLSKSVLLLGRISEQEKNYLLLNSHLFIMPNITIEGDAEGFGISIIEATSKGLPVIAAGVEGITSAVVHNETGLLVEEKNSDHFVQSINSCKLNRSEVIRITRDRFDWSKLVDQYLTLFNALQKRDD